MKIIFAFVNTKNNNILLIYYRFPYKYKLLKTQKSTDLGLESSRTKLVDNLKTGYL